MESWYVDKVFGGMLVPDSNDPGYYNAFGTGIGLGGRQKAIATSHNNRLHSPGTGVAGQSDCPGLREISPAERSSGRKSEGLFRLLLGLRGWSRTWLWE